MHASNKLIQRTTESVVPFANTQKLRYLRQPLMRALNICFWQFSEVELLIAEGQF